MDNPRFNEGSTRRAISRSTGWAYSQRIQMPELGCRAGSASPGQKRIFAIVSPPIPASV